MSIWHSKWKRSMIYGHVRVSSREVFDESLAIPWREEIVMETIPLDFKREEREQVYPERKEARSDRTIRRALLPH